MSQPQFTRRTCRPRDAVEQLSRDYPGAWQALDAFRADKGRNGLPDWPAWCYLPMAAAYAVVSGCGAGRVSIDRAGDVARMAALSAWRMTQGIYRFDPAVFEAVRDTPVDGDIPADVLYRLPEWCVYVETPGMQAFGGPLHGAWVHLEWDANDGRTELRLLLDTDVGLHPIPLHLGRWSLAESLERMQAEAVRHGFGRVLSAQAPGGVLPPDAAAGAMRPVVEPIVSLVLYLCSQAGEIGDGSRRPGNPEPKRTKRGWRLFQADRPTTWDVGLRLGAALRRAYQAEQTGSGGGEHAGPRPHIRRAHWHGFRSGPMKRADGSDIPTAERRFDLRWLPPIAVAMGDATPADMPAVVRPVR